MRFIAAILALFAAAPAFAEWREAETAHFRIVSSGDEKGLVRFAERLEQFHTLLRLATGANEANRRVVKVRVFLVDSIGAVKVLYGKPESDVAGFYSPREDGAIAVVPRSTGDGIFTGQLVLFHEYAHHYMLQYTPAAYPSWYVEGFAEIASTASFERKGSITFGKAASHRQDELDYGLRYSVVKMLDGSYVEDRKRGVGWSYGDAWLLSHYLTFSDTRRGQLRAYLNGINLGKKPAEAAAVFGDLQVLQREVSSYHYGRSFPYRAVPLPEAPADGIKLRTLGLAEAAIVDQTIEFERRTELPSKPNDDSPDGDDKNKKDKPKPPKIDFETRLAEAKRKREEWIAGVEILAGRFASDPAGWLLLADARCVSEQFAACAAAADRALALAPQDSRAIVRKAEAEIGLAADLPSAERNPRIEAAQEHLLEANAANPDDPLPLLAFYRSFAEMGRGADQDGITALYTAVQLVPQMFGPRLTLAGEFIARGRLRDARIVLRPLAFSPHDGGAAQQARAMLEKIEAALAEGPLV